MGWEVKCLRIFKIENKFFKKISWGCPQMPGSSIFPLGLATK